MRATQRQNVILRAKQGGGYKRIRLQKHPDLKFEQDLIKNGIINIAGVDEVGRGSWAGPLVACAVILNPDHRLYKLRDSKVLDQKRREELYPKIIESAHDFGIGEVSVEEIDFFGLSDAIKIAGKRALNTLKLIPGAVLLDGTWNYLKNSKKDENLFEIKTIPHGDARSLTIAAASIIAKVYRDNLLIKLHDSYPLYDFASNKGYPSPKHQQGLVTYGPSEVHRKSYAPIKRLIDGLD